jgi:hypothetical protein
VSETFDEMVSRIPPDQRSVGDGHCYFGAPADRMRGLTALDAMPPRPVEVSFLGGGEQADLVRAFTESPYAAMVESINLGNSSYYLGRQLDYTAGVAALLDAHLPRVRRLALGVWDLFCNAHSIYGRLGDISRAPSAAPSLEVLELNGHFTLTGPLDLPTVRTLSVNLGDYVIGPDMPPLHQETVTHLLSSRMPAVEEIWLLLQNFAGGPYRYRLPAGFLDGAVAPSLACFEVDAAALDDGEADRIRTSRMARTTARVDIALDD